VHSCMHSELGRSRIQTLVALAASASSLAAIVFLGVTQAEAGDSDPTAQSGPLDDEVAAPTAFEASADRARSTSRASTAEPTPQGEAELPGPEVQLVAVPVVAGQRLWIARQRMKEAGLVLGPRNGTRRVPTDDYGAYQIAEGQEFPATAPRGSKVELQVEYWSPPFARGY